jgi:hypothetical protein
VNPELKTFRTADIRAVFGQVEQVFDLAASMAAEASGDTGEYSGDRGALNVERIHLASPLETIVALGSPFATVMAIRYAVDLISEVWNIPARVRRDRARLQAEEFAALVEAQKSKEELLRPAAEQVRAGGNRALQLPPRSVDIWLGTPDDPPPPEP